MNLVQLVKYIEAIALEHPLVKSFYEGSVYEHLNSKEIKYGAFVLTQQDFNSVVKDDNVKRYTFQATYVDRLTEDESNKLVIQTDGINTIHEIFNYITTNAQTADIQLPITFTTFTQKFADKCGGAYAIVTVEVDDETGDCDFYYEDILVEPIPGTSHTTVLDNYYTKVEVEDLIAGVEAGIMTNYYTKTESDGKYETIENVDLLEDIVSGHTTNIYNLQSGKADKETTLSGYGITNAYTKNEVDIKFDNTRTYKILNTVVSTWVESSTYAAYKYEAIINIENLIEGDFVLVIFDDMEATNGNYSPIQQQYNGYIKIYSKVNNEITIPTMVITKILL